MNFIAQRALSLSLSLLYILQFHFIFGVLKVFSFELSWVELDFERKMNAIEWITNDQISTIHTKRERERELQRTLCTLLQQSIEQLQRMKMFKYVHVYTKTIDA